MSSQNTQRNRSFNASNQQQYTQYPPPSYPPPPNQQPYHHQHAQNASIGSSNSQWSNPQMPPQNYINASAFNNNNNAYQFNQAYPPHRGPQHSMNNFEYAQQQKQQQQQQPMSEYYQGQNMAIYDNADDDIYTVKEEDATTIISKTTHNSDTNELTQNTVTMTGSANQFSENNQYSSSSVGTESDSDSESNQYSQQQYAHSVNSFNTFNNNNNNGTQQDVQSVHSFNNNGSFNNAQPFQSNVLSAEKQKMQKWFIETLRLPQYFDLFVVNGYEDLSFFDDNIADTDLIELGIGKKPHRNKIVREIKKLLLPQHKLPFIQDAPPPPPPPPAKSNNPPPPQSPKTRAVPPPPSKFDNAKTKQAAFDKITGKNAQQKSPKINMDIQRKRQQSRTVYVTKELPENAKRYRNFSVYDDDKKQQYDEYIARMNKKSKKKKKKKKKKEKKKKRQKMKEIETRSGRVYSVSAPNSPVLDDLNVPIALTQSEETFEEYELENDFGVDLDAMHEYEQYEQRYDEPMHAMSQSVDLEEYEYENSVYQSEEDEDEEHDDNESIVEQFKRSKRKKKDKKKKKKKKKHKKKKKDIDLPTFYKKKENNVTILKQDKYQKKLDPQNIKKKKEQKERDNLSRLGFEIKAKYRYRLDDGSIGICKYRGRPHFAKAHEDWIGLMIEYGEGQNDGSVDGHKYFRCAMGKGVMVRPERIIEDMGKPNGQKLSEKEIKGSKKIRRLIEDIQFEREQKLIYDIE